MIKPVEPTIHAEEDDESSSDLFTVILLLMIAALCCSALATAFLLRRKRQKASKKLYEPSHEVEKNHKHVDVFETEETGYTELTPKSPTLGRAPSDAKATCATPTRSASRSDDGSAPASPNTAVRTAPFGSSPSAAQSPSAAPARRGVVITVQQRAAALPGQGPLPATRRVARPSPTNSPTIMGSSPTRTSGRASFRPCCGEPSSRQQPRRSTGSTDRGSPLPTPASARMHPTSPLPLTAQRAADYRAAPCGPPPLMVQRGAWGGVNPRTVGRARAVVVGAGSA